MVSLQTLLLGVAAVIGWASLLVLLWALLWAYGQTVRNVDQYP